jgi:hypothetical protein
MKTPRLVTLRPLVSDFVDAIVDGKPYEDAREQPVAEPETPESRASAKAAQQQERDKLLQSMNDRPDIVARLQKSFTTDQTYTRQLQDTLDAIDTIHRLMDEYGVSEVVRWMRLCAQARGVRL